MKILIVDDSKAMRMIVTRTLRQAGYGGHDIIEAENGVEAMGIVNDQSPDLILSDWNMPEMNGLELLEALRASGSQVPFCFVTSETSAQMRETAQEAGALALIVKPFTADSFTDALGTVVPA